MSKAKLLCRIIRSAHLFAIASSSLAVNSMVCGYHVYLAVWEPCVEERFIALHESGNPHDSHAMAVYRDEDPGVGLGSPLSSLSLACPLLALACSPLPLACSLLPLSLLRSNLGAMSRSFDWMGWTTRYVNRLVPPKTGREMLWFCSRRQLSEVVGQPTTLRASSNVREVPKMRLN